MINHVKTLLLNKPAGYYDGIPGGDYLFDSFNPVVLPAGLSAVRSILMPVSKSRMVDLQIADTLVKLAAAPDLARYAASFDRRVIAPEVSLPQLLSRVVTVDQISNTGDAKLYYQLDYDSYPIRMAQAGYRAWNIVSDDDDTVVITDDAGTVTSVNFLEPDTGQGTTNRYELFGRFLRIFFSVPSGVLTGTFEYDLSLAVAAPYNPADVLRALDTASASAGIGQALFKAIPDSTIMTDLQTIFLSNGEAALRLGAATLAYVGQVTRLL